MATSYELVSRAGRPVYATDTIEAARARKAALAARGTDVRIERVVISRRAVA